MKTVSQWLTLVSQAYECDNQSALARLLDVTRASICQNKSGMHSISVATAVKVADLLGVHPLLVIASTLHQQAHSPKEKKFWQAVYRHYDQVERREPGKASAKDAERRRVIRKPPDDYNRS